MHLSRSGFRPKSFLACIAVLGGLTAGHDAAAGTVLHATFSLGGAQEVPPSGSPGTGMGKVSYDTVTNLLTWKVSFQGLQGVPTAAHFHGPAAPGVNAGIQVNIGVATNPIVGSATLSNAQENDLLGGLWYVNIHSNLFPGGEIRGQVTPFTGPWLHATFGLDGSQEVPANASPGTGVAHVSLNCATNLLSWSVSFQNLIGTPTAAHFHGPAPAGVNAGIQVNIGVGSNPATGSATLSAQQRADLLAGLWYVNVHSNTFPGGEIRGQVTPVFEHVTLNELFYDSIGTDDGNTFVELAGPAGAALGGWKVVSVEGGAAGSCGQANTTITLPAGATIGADGLYVIADTAGGTTNVVVPPSHNGGLADLEVNNADFENGTDVVQLVNALGQVVDVVAYQDAAQPLCSDSDVNNDPMLEAVPALDFAFGDIGLARFPAGADTDCNDADFVPNRAPSPGADGEPRALVFQGSSTISGAAGGTVDLDVYTARPGTQYLVLAFITQPTSQTLGGLPFDLLTNIFINLTILPNPFVQNFTGNLDMNGRASATLNVPAGTNIPLTATIFFSAIAPIDSSAIVTNDVGITLTP